MKGTRTLGILGFILGFLMGGIPAQAEVGVTDREIKIGGIVDLSGPIAFMGKGVSDGALLYFKHINDQGGIHGRKINYLVEDDAYQGPRAVAAAKKLVSRDQVFCLFMILGSLQTNALYPGMEKEGVPVLLPATQTRDMGIPPKKYLFHADTSYTTQSKIAIEYIVEELKDKKPRIGVLYQDDLPGEDWLRGCRIAAKHYGFELAAAESYKRGTIDFSPQVAKLNSAKAAYVLKWTLVREPAAIMKEAMRLQYKPLWITSTASADNRVIALAGEAAYFGQGFLATGIAHNALAEDTPKIREFKESMKKFQLGDINNFYNWYGYGHATTLVEGMKRAGKDLTREGLIKALETFKEYENGVLSPVTWGPNLRAGGTSILMHKAEKGVWLPFGGWRKSKIPED
jgi:branched-chain amino acid transport system substrate-binding protein